MAFNGIPKVPTPVNDVNRSYLPGSPERAELKDRLAHMSSEQLDIPIVIGGKEIRTGRVQQVVMPHNHRHVLGQWHAADAEHVQQAIAAAAEASREWASWAWHERAAVLLRAAELLTTTWRATINAATMLGQSKNVFQAEIDAASEMVDFWRFNPFFAQQIYEDQPISSHTMWNALEYRPLEGFVYAVTPFNFTSIGGNLPTAPALMGNTVIWKPASSAILSGYYIVKLLEAAGMPPGVINFIPGNAVEISNVLLDSPHLAGIHFTGSTGVFQSMWTKVGQNIARYKSYPRLVGETGGKDFIVAHPSADVQEFSVAIVRGGFEYQGQKCSAASRIYVPKSLWPDVTDRVVSMMREIKVGDVADFRTFMGAVIDRKSFDKISGYLEDARKNATIIEGGTASDEVGYFVSPTLVQAPKADYRLMCEEIFGPVVTVYVYDDARWTETLAVIDQTSPYALTGAVFARDRSAIREATRALRNAAGNFYINDKPTGAVVGQQPFGGARASGTNDKAGSKMNLLRWVSARTMKETFSSPREYTYPYMSEE
ncbi:MAG TPA: L-glutamate gamma-semialdehyde dehydrogenase [Vicinamibacterales bacterium]|jgi:1-pyrroline-5-carboxylate dehydrogenase|nr:L-glutamate gamma-semialdehyde dehydrogenase [Vicinamibacterales bacterium]